MDNFNSHDQARFGLGCNLYPPAANFTAPTSSEEAMCLPLSLPLPLRHTPARHGFPPPSNEHAAEFEIEMQMEMEMEMEIRIRNRKASKVRIKA